MEGYLQPPGVSGNILLARPAQLRKHRDWLFATSVPSNPQSSRLRAFVVTRFERLGDIDIGVQEEALVCGRDISYLSNLAQRIY
jgi:hypothetical protein